jgi:hypothetical protein
MVTFLLPFQPTSLMHFSSFVLVLHVLPIANLSIHDFQIISPRYWRTICFERYGHHHELRKLLLKTDTLTSMHASPKHTLVHGPVYCCVSVTLDNSTHVSCAAATYREYYVTSWFQTAPNGLTVNKSWAMEWLYVQTVAGGCKYQFL